MTIQDLLTELLNHDTRKEVVVHVEGQETQYKYITVDTDLSTHEKLVFTVNTQ